MPLFFCLLLKTVDKRKEVPYNMCMDKQTLLDIEGYNAALRALGYVDSGLSASRGSYCISSYRPGAKKGKKLKCGYVEVHTDWDWDTKEYNFFQIVTPVGTFVKLADAISALKKT